MNSGMGGMSSRSILRALASPQEGHAVPELPVPRPDQAVRPGQPERDEQQPWLVQVLIVGVPS
ncbi:MAG TPA: hypothetical protein VMA95_16120 [Streptosporangiaceae bacterium]|nr:hypothetical protein [Streptosporangiaceae bacterium]